MLSMTHMIVLFIVVLVVFGPHKLPELAKGLGKLMAEFRKASTDFKSAFEQEMRDIERQALQAERKKAAEAAATAAVAASTAPGTVQPATLGTPEGAETPALNLDADTRATEALTVTPVAESVARVDGEGVPLQGNPEASATEAHTANTAEASASSASDTPA